MAKHAMQAEDKVARKGVILKAARELYEADPRNLPSVASIAQRSNLAKGTIYIYFKTKEAIFAELLFKERLEIFDVMQSAFHDQTKTPQECIKLMIKSFMSRFVDNIYFMRLDSIGYTILEPNMELEQFVTEKQALFEKLVSAGNVVDSFFSLPSGKGTNLLARSYALSKGMWQVTDVPDHFQKGTSEQIFEDFRIGFIHGVSEALMDYWSGALKIDLN